MIEWIQPNNMGSQIIGYRVAIRENDGDYSPDLTNCDASKSEIIAQRYCLVPISLLRDSLY